MNEDRKPSENQVVQPTYVLAPGYYPDWEPNDQVSLADHIRVLWKRRALIVGVSLGLAVLAFMVSLALPRQYESRATLLVQPPVFSTELRPATLDVETYESIVNSDSMKSRVREKLIGDGVLEEGEPLGVLSTELHTSRLRDQAYSPVIDLVVRANSAEKARLIADTWAQIGVEESSGLASRGKQGTLEFIQREYPTNKDRLSELESELKTSQDKYDRRIRDLEEQWDRRITAFKTEWNIDVLEQHSSALEEKLTGNIVRLNELQLEIKGTRDTLEQLKVEIQQHPQFVVISKAITDDALWDRIGRDADKGTAAELQNLKLRSEYLNPVYQALLQRVADTQVLYETQIPQEQHLKDQIAEQEKEVRDLNELILGKQFDLQKMNRDRQTELALLKRERDFTVVSLSREVEGSKKTFATLSEQWESARLAQAEVDQDVKIGSLAVAPELPVSPRPLLNTAIAVVVGFMLAIMLAFILEFVQRGSFSDDRPKPARS